MGVEGLERGAGSRVEWDKRRRSKMVLSREIQKCFRRRTPLSTLVIGRHRRTLCTVQIRIYILSLPKIP